MRHRRYSIVDLGVGQLLLKTLRCGIPDGSVETLQHATIEIHCIVQNRGGVRICRTKLDQARLRLARKIDQGSAVRDEHFVTISRYRFPWRRFRFFEPRPFPLQRMTIVVPEEQIEKHCIEKST